MDLLIIQMLMMLSFSFFYIISRDLLTTMVSPTGLEPVTHRLKICCCYQLSYEDKLVVLTRLQLVTRNLEDSCSNATELQNQLILWVKMDSNQQHLDLQSSALPLELFTQLINKLRISRKSC